jgi:hypothetical protein
LYAKRTNFALTLLSFLPSFPLYPFFFVLSQWNYHDGWYGGPGGSDPARSENYCYNKSNPNPPGTYTLVTCDTPPANYTLNFACEQDKTTPCLFNVSADPCEFVDLSADPMYASKLAALMTRLQEYRATAVLSSEAHPNPDGKNCPYIANATSASGVATKAWMPCNNNGSKPLPPWTPSPSPSPSPPPGNGKKLQHAQDGFKTECVLESLEMGTCDSESVKLWSAKPNVGVGNQILKYLEARGGGGGGGGGCGTWNKVHLGVDRGDTNTFTLTAIDGEGTTIESSLCKGCCIGLDAEGKKLAPMNCTAMKSGVDGWSLLL